MPTIAESGNDNYAVSVAATAAVAVEGYGRGQSGIDKHGQGEIGFPRNVRITNTGLETAYLGYGSDVTTSNGFPLPVDGVIELNLVYFDELWCIDSGGTATLRILITHGKGDPA